MAFLADDPYTARDANDVAVELGVVVAAGLDEKEAEQRLARDGRNELMAAPGVPVWRKAVAQFQDPLVYLLMVAVLVSIVAWVVEGTHGVPVDAVVIVGILLANAALGFIQEARAESAVAALQSMTEVVSTVLRDGVLTRVPSAVLVRGDVLALSEGDYVGADARLVTASALRVAEASLTGESEAVEKDVESLPGSPQLGDRSNMVFKGTAVTQGTGRAVVTATGMATEVGSIARLLEATVRDPTPLEVEITHVGKVLGIAVVAIAGATMATIWVVDGVHTLTDAVTVLLLGVSLAVAAVPEGLPAILSVVLSIGVQRLAVRDAIVKRLSSVETLGSASVICSDKTGTLTRNEMTIQRVITASGSARVSGVGYAPVGDIESSDSSDGPGLLAEEIVVLCGGSLASNAVLNQIEGEWQIVGDPTEAAFVVAERKLGLHERRGTRFTRIAEVPFTSTRKFMSTVEVDHEHGDQLVLVSKGAPDVLLTRCSSVRVGTETVPLDEATREEILDDVETLSSDALRTLSVAYRPLGPDEFTPLEGRSASDSAASLEHDLVFAGTVGIIDPARTEAEVAVQEARRAGIRTIMITGDHPVTAMRIARDLGIATDTDTALSGSQIEDLDGDGLRQAVGSTSVYARVAPEHKLRIVDALQAEGNVVAMTGDGVNDAPALKSADIGVAMGITGTEVTKEAAVMILADDNFATIVVAVRQGRVIFENIKKFLRYLLSSNTGEVLTVFGGVVLAGAIGLDQPLRPQSSFPCSPLRSCGSTWSRIRPRRWRWGSTPRPTM